MTLRPDQRRFGIEIEISERNALNPYPTTAHVAEVVRAALAAFPEELRPVVNTGSYGHSDGTAWDVKTDASCGYEVCTPAIVLADLPKVEAILRGLRQAGYKATASCGLHVHIETRDFTLRRLQRLLRLWARHEPVLYTFVNRARRTNRYCGPIGRSITQTQRSVTPEGMPRIEAVEMIDLPETMDGLRGELSARGVVRHTAALNLSNFWASGRIEVRIHHGSTDFATIAAWVRLLLQLAWSASVSWNERTTFRPMPASDAYAALWRDLIPASERAAWDPTITRLVRFAARRHPTFQARERVVGGRV